MKRGLKITASLAAGIALIYALTWHTWGVATAIGVHPYPAGTPWEYQMWSGIIPALTVLTLFGSVSALYHLHSCHFVTCWRLGKHRVGGTPWCSMHVGYAKQELTDSDRLDKIISLLEIGHIGKPSS